MRAARGIPSNSCSPVKAPANQNGMEKATINKKNFRGDLVCDVVVFEDSSSTDCGYGGTCGSSKDPGDDLSFQELDGRNLHFESWFEVRIDAGRLQTRGSRKPYPSG